MGFTKETIDLLNKPLDIKNVKKKEGKYDYVEGWKMQDQANKVFGFDGWSCETVYNREVCRVDTKISGVDGFTVGYEAKVRLNIHGVIREGTGHGSQVARSLFACIEGAAKEAETDALKRAFKSFGNPFGLALYDKERVGVGSVEEYDVALAKAELLAEELKSKFSKAGTLEEINKIWTSNAKNIAEAKKTSSDVYKKIFDIFLSKKKSLNNDYM